MKLTIDNLDGRGPRDYTSVIDSLRLPRVKRSLNKPAELRFSLVGSGPDFVVPRNGARVTLGKMNGQDVFTGYLTSAPEFEYLGWGERGPIYRYNLVATSDELLLDRKRSPRRPPFVERSAGDALRQLTEDLLPGFFDQSAVQDVEPLAFYAPDPQKSWSEHAAEIAQRVRACYRALGGKLLFGPVGGMAWSLDESDARFSPSGLKMRSFDRLLNDVTILGRSEPSTYVKDYFVGDGYSLRFYLSQLPFSQSARTLLDEEYAGTAPDPTHWTVNDTSRAIEVSGGKLQVSGGTGTDGQAAVSFVENFELGGAVELQHGDVILSGASDGVLGGLFPDTLTVAGCLAGFRITPNGSQSKIQALINGGTTGPAISTVAGHHYSFTTRFYATEVHRCQGTFHSSAKPGGQGRGGAAIAADVRFVLEVHEIDPSDPGSLVAPSTVLYDDVIKNAPAFCAYALINARHMYCSVAFTRFLQAPDTEVRSALPQSGFRTRLVGSMIEGAECLVTQDPALQFFPQSLPQANELIEVRYRGSQRSVARIANAADIAARKNGSDDGVRGLVRYMVSPPPLSSVDCENAALAVLDDALPTAWSGEYDTWSDFLPGNAADIFPGDAIEVAAPSRGASFRAIVRAVEIDAADLAGDRSRYKIRFADDAAESLAPALEAARVSALFEIPATDLTVVGRNFLPALSNAEVSDVTSTTVSVDAGISSPAGGGFEVRRTDYGWGQDNDRNLIGRFGTRSFTLPRWARVQDYFLRQYDNSNPAKYSRYSTALHIDYPL